MIHKVFAPEIVFKDYIKHTWCDNIKGSECCKIPLKKEFKENGVYALEIIPDIYKNYSSFCIATNSDWTTLDISKFINPIISFDIVTSDSISLKLDLKNKDNKNVFTTRFDITSNNEWTEYTTPISPNVTDIRLVAFSIPANPEIICLMKNIIIKNKI